MLDKLTRMAIASAVKESMEVYSERWLTADELCKQFGMFSRDWLKRYGHLLPRTRAEVSDGGTVHASGWSYPQHKIARMVADGEIKRLTL